MIRKKKIYAGVTAGLILAVTGGSVGYHFLNASAKEIENRYEEATLQHGDISLKFTEEGITEISDITQFPDFDVTAAEMLVEEVYVSSGDMVEKGDALYKLSEESIAGAKAYYEEAVADAKKEKEKAETAYEAGKLEAEYQLASSKAASNSASSVYDTANSQLDQAVEEAKAALTDAQTQISVYQNNLDNNIYYEDAGVKEKKDALSNAKDQTKAAKKTYQKAKEDYDKMASSVNSQIAELQSVVANSADVTADAQTIAQKVNQLAEDNKTLAEKKASFDTEESNYQKVQDMQEQAQQAYDAAENTYEKAVSDANMKKENLENSLPLLEQAYNKAVNEAQTGKVDTKNTYDTTVLQGEYAQASYNATVNSLQNAVDTAAETLNNLEKEQTALLSLKDGVICAGQSGTLAEVSYEAGNCLNSYTALAGYCDTDTIMVSVEVPQEDIAHVTVGDTVDVNISGVRDGELEGIVSSIASEATSDGSMSNVTYAVMINIDNSEGTISSGSSAYVTFTYGELEDVDYIDTAALSNIDGENAKVKKYNAAGEVVEVSVVIGKTTDQYTVISDGITKEDICLIDRGGNQ